MKRTISAPKRPTSPSIPKSGPKYLLFSILGVTVFLSCIAVAAFFFVDFTIEGSWEGLFVFKGKAKPIEIKDDIFLGDKYRLLYGVSFEPLYDAVRLMKAKHPPPPYLSYEWNRRLGRGFVINHLPDGRELLTCFGRYLDEGGHAPDGLFVGGGLPYRRGNDEKLSLNETGMAFYDGRKWHHIWCSVNELIHSGITRSIVYPGQWAFLGSDVLKDTPRELIFRSLHNLTLDNVPLRIERWAFFRAGDVYFNLVIRLRNQGFDKLAYRYIYGDDPWVGDYGNSKGDIGWTKDRVIMHEGEIDVGKNDFLGMYDFGNCLVGEGYNFSQKANFIQWLGGNKPDMAYFTNNVGPLASQSEGIPLHTEFSRSIMLEWGPRILLPGESAVIRLAVGMAQSPATADQLPQKPDVFFDSEWESYLR